MLITISAGHSTVYPKDPGAVGNGFVEAEVAVRMRDKVAAILRGRGFSVLEDGADGISEPLRKALRLARRSSISVEFHLNAVANPQAHGIESLSTTQHKTFATNISQAIANVTGLRLRGQNGWRNQNAGAHHRLAFCIAGGIIVEPCFISNKNDIETFMSKFDEVCVAVADVIADAATGKKKNRVIGINDKGEDVRLVQVELVDEKLLCKSEVDGWFGQRTKKAVSAFQALNSLDVDGLVGQLTRSVLFR